MCYYCCYYCELIIFLAVSSRFSGIIFSWHSVTRSWPYAVFGTRPFPSDFISLFFFLPVMGPLDERIFFLQVGLRRERVEAVKGCRLWREGRGAHH